MMRYMMRYLGNALSLGMLDFVSGTFPGSGFSDAAGNGGVAATLHVDLLTDEQARAWARAAPWESCVGHADTAQLLTALLDAPVECQRVSTSLLAGDELLVAQYNGPRLPEGATALPEGARIRWMLVRVRRSVAVAAEGGSIGTWLVPPTDRAWVRG